MFDDTQEVESKNSDGIQKVDFLGMNNSLIKMTKKNAFASARKSCNIIVSAPFGVTRTVQIERVDEVFCLTRKPPTTTRVTVEAEVSAGTEIWVSGLNIEALLPPTGGKLRIATPSRKVAVSGFVYEQTADNDEHIIVIKQVMKPLLLLIGSAGDIMIRQKNI